MFNYKITLFYIIYFIIFLLSIDFKVDIITMLD